jgi:hypothetical protein
MKDAVELCRGLLRKAKSDRIAMEAMLAAQALAGISHIGLETVGLYRLWKNGFALSLSTPPIIHLSAPRRRSARHPSSSEEGSVLNNSPPDLGGVARRAPGWLSAAGRPEGGSRNFGEAKQAAEKPYNIVILSAAKDLALSIFKAMRDSWSPPAPQNDSAEGSSPMDKEKPRT